jgi:hypothetical protein
MRLPRVRFTVRRLMVAVAILAVVFGVTLESIRLGRRWAYYHRRAAYYEQSEELFRFIGRGERQAAASTSGQAAKRSLQQAAECELRVPFYAELKRRHRYAEWRPWTSLPPDPDPPSSPQMPPPPGPPMP